VIYIAEPTQKKKTKDPMSLISTKKKGVRKELRKLQTQKQRISAAKRSSHLPINGNHLCTCIFKKKNLFEKMLIGSFYFLSIKLEGEYLKIMQLGLKMTS
jgi:hypothetical protein